MWVWCALTNALTPILSLAKNVGVVHAKQVLVSVIALFTSLPDPFACVYVCVHVYISIHVCVVTCAYMSAWGALW